MYFLRNPLKNYPWGSRTALAQFEERAPSGDPEAERWFGTHALGCSSVLLNGTEQALTELRRSHGSQPELPFLLKLLAAGQPLSLQAHPNPAQALEGYARETALGLPLDAPHRSYKDQHAKPEIIVALTPFDALSGFRPMQDIASALGGSGIAYLDDSIHQAATLGDEHGQRMLFSTWMADRQGALRDAFVSFSALAPTLLPPQTYAWWKRASEAFPGDATAMIALLLEFVQLAPGEAIFLPAGNLHAYLGGLGVELMGPSDNVLRGGMTPKHIDVDELTRVLLFSPFRPRILRAEPIADGPAVWPTPDAPFRLALESAGMQEQGWLANSNDEIVLCISGQMHFGEQALKAGDAVYIEASAPPSTVRGAARWVRASGAGARWVKKERS